MRDGGVENKNNEFEINQLKERAKLESTEMEKIRKDNEQLRGLREEERLKWEGKWSQEETEIINEVTAEIIRETKETKEVTETQIVTETETWEIEGELIGMKNEHTQVEIVEDNGGELADCVVNRCE